MAHVYLIHGLVLSLPFACEDLMPVALHTAPDLRVTEGVVTRELDAPTLRDKMFDALPERFLFRGGMRSARFLVENGETIIFERNRLCEDSLFLHHLLYPVMAAVLRQRQFLVLHASSAISARGAVLIAGESGAGKSTTTARLVAQGWPLQTDDVSVLRVDGDGTLKIPPGTSHVHLHEDAAASLPFDTRDLVRRDWHRMKIAVPLPAVAERKPCAVSRIVYLKLSRETGLHVKRVIGRDKLPLLLRSIYGPLLAEQVVARSDMFARALASIEMISITRPEGAWTLDAVIGAITDG